MPGCVDGSISSREKISRPGCSSGQAGRLHNVLSPGTNIMPQRRGHRLKFFKLWLYLLIPLAAVAQTPSCNWKQSVTASSVGTSNANNTLQPTCNAFVLTWTSTGFSAVTIQLESSNLSGSGFAAFSGTSTVIAGTTNPTTALSGAIIVQVQTVLSFIRFNVTAATGSGTISTQIYGFSGISPAASAASGGGGGGGAIQTETWTVGTGGITAGDLVCISQSGSPTTAIKCPISVVFNQIEIAIIGIAQTTTAAAGSGTVIVRGLATCLFDTINAPTAGHLAQISLQTAGRCQDSGAGNANFGVPVLGVVMTTGLINTTQSVYVFSSGLVGSKITTVSPLTITNPASGTNFQVKAGNATSAQGNGTKLQFSTGTTTTNNCAKFDANGNIVDAGAACATGTVTGVTASSPLSSTGGTTPDISIPLTTGTGSTVVLATSPTLVTPLLGTPTSVNLTNALGLPAGGLAAIAADGIFGNFTAGVAIPTVQSIPSCAADGVHGLTYPSHTITCTTLSTGGGSSGGGITAYLGSVGFIGASTRFTPVSGSLASNTVETTLQSISPSAATMANLKVNIVTAPGGSDTIVYTLRVNTANSTLTCTITGAAKTCSDTTHSVNVASGDLLDWQCVSTVANTSNTAILANFGTSGVGVTSVTASGGLQSSGGTTPDISPLAPTGSGSTLVLANGPTMTNPIVGTQSQNDNSTKGASTAYVDLAISNAIAGVNPAVAVQAATAAVLPNSPTYNNGVSGVGATLTAGSAAALTVDGYVMTLLDRVLVKNQASAFQNGVYFLSTLGTGVIPYVLTRALDYNTPSDMNNTGSIPVVNGTVNAVTQWVQTSKVTTVGTDAVTFTQFTINPTTQLTGTPTNHGVAVGTSTQAVNFSGAGTAGQVFTSNGASSDPSFQPAGGGGAVGTPESHTASASASLAFTTCMATASTDIVQIVLENVVPATNQANLLIQVSTDGGATYDTTANYTTQLFVFRAGGSAGGGSGDTPDVAFQLTTAALTNGIGNTANRGLSGSLIFPFTSGQQPGIMGTVSYFDGSSHFLGASVGGMYVSTTAVNAFRVQFNTGNIATGTVRCYPMTH